MGSWLKEATEFLEHNKATLATRRVWLFSSGPLLGSSKQTPAPIGSPTRWAPRQDQAAAGERRLKRCQPLSVLADTKSSWGVRPQRPAEVDGGAARAAHAGGEAGAACR